jgi:putative transposase
MRWGRDYYARGAVPGGRYRNGYRMARVKSAEGTIECSAPRIAEWDEPFRSCLRTIIGGRTEALQTLAVEMYARRPSTRDISDSRARR